MSSSKKLIYYDNNATTVVYPEVRKVMNFWINHGNPSSNYKSAKETQEMMNNFRLYIAKLCKIKLEGPDGFSVIFTSGASESNSTIILSIAMAYKKKTGKTPHIITSSVEHSSILMCCENAEASGLIELTKLNPAPWTISPEDLKKAIKPNTALVTIMTVNNETGIKNDIYALGNVCHKYDIPFHTDAVQYFPKYPVVPERSIDAFSVSFHKMHGPIGCGILVIRDSLITGYSLCSIIAGTQNYKLRGGTENAPAILASFEATRLTYQQRTSKNKLLSRLTMKLLSSLSDALPTIYMEQFDEKNTKQGSVILIRPTNSELIMPGVILLAVYRENFCNKAAISALEKVGIIVSVGSACHTDDGESSHVVIAHKVPKILQDKILRISLGDDNQLSEISRFVELFKSIVLSDVVIVEKRPK
jgi:cysteine desulfurase